MELVKYPDGSSYYKVDERDAGYQKTFFINTYEDLWHLNQFVDAYNNKTGHEPSILIPWLIDSQADARFHENESFGLQLVCEFLNSMPAKFTIFHPHNPALIAAYMYDVQFIDNSRFISYVLNTLSKDKKKYPAIIKDEFIGSEGYYRDSRLDENIVLMSADAGGYKSLMKLCNKIGWAGQTASAAKSRKFENGQSILTQIVCESDFHGKDILIVDDICIYGGTFKRLAELLKERNCGDIYLAVSHLTVQNLEEDPVTNYFTKVFTTNSKYNSYCYLPKYASVTQVIENLEIIKLF